MGEWPLFVVYTQSENIGVQEYNSYNTSVEIDRIFILYHYAFAFLEWHYSTAGLWECA